MILTRAKIVSMRNSSRVIDAMRCARRDSFYVQVHSYTDVLALASSAIMLSSALIVSNGMGMPTTAQDLGYAQSVTGLGLSQMTRIARLAYKANRAYSKVWGYRNWVPEGS